MPPEVSDDSPLGAVAVLCLEAWKAAPHGLLVLAGSELRAERLGVMLHALAPETMPMVLPAWGTVPNDGIPPSRQVRGRRASVLRRLGGKPERPLVLATADAALQLVPSPEAWADTALALQPGIALEPDALKQFFERAGYDLDARVDEPGEYAIQGQAIDVFPAGGLSPVRIVYSDGAIAALSSYDPATQRTSAELAEIVLDPMNELLIGEGNVQDGAPPAASLFDYLPHAHVMIDGGVEARAAAWLEQVAEALQSRNAVPALRSANANGIEASVEASYMTERAWRSRLERCATIRLQSQSAAPDTIVPRFCAEPVPGRALRAFIEAQRAAGNRIILTAGEDAALKMLEQRTRRAGVEAVARAETWHEALGAKKAGAVLLKVDFESGFLLPSRRIAVITAADVLGSRIAHEVPFASAQEATEPQQALQFGDVVIHLERGAAILSGIERVSEGDMIRLEFDDADMLLPVEELALIWKYSAEDSIPLDRADGSSWAKRRAGLETELAATASKLIALDRDRREKSAPKLVPPAADYERFVARFRFFPTPDQVNAATDVLSDLASGRPMDRLVSGDVGYGKTEVAMRAAAAAILGGKQVALAVPTTVLARQHLDSFRKRFAGLGIAIGHLSRLASAADQKAAKKGLAEGSIRLVIGTHAIAAKGVRYKELGLVIVDEEQRFGARDKAKLRGLARDAHILTLTATPIPRTMQSAVAGLMRVSVLASPPARRLPVRTIVTPYDGETVRAALHHERRRGGQSFIVCPRIEDIPPWQERLRQVVPDLQCRIVHAKMPAGEIDEAMLLFAQGDGDVLLATNIIESGLDLPRANTMLVWRPDRFGLAQLHQLRGRVGRGAQRGYAYLLTDPDKALAAPSEKRLKAIEQMTELGAGFRISQRDLDLRGAGDLFGEDQTGHMKLVGPELYRHLLERALRHGRGETLTEDFVPELRLEVAGHIPTDYIQDDAVRLELYDRIAKAEGADALERLLEEIEDRFGPMPDAMASFLALAKVRSECQHAGISRIDAGPKAIAISFRPGFEADREETVRTIEHHWSEGRLVIAEPTGPETRIETVRKILARLRRQQDREEA